MKFDSKEELSYLRQKIMAGLGVSESMMNGPMTYATSSISARKRANFERRTKSEQD